MRSIVKVKWQDSSFTHGWSPLDSADNDHIAQCESVGYLLREDDKEVILAMGFSDGDTTHDRIAIPKRSVDSIVEILP